MCGRFVMTADMREIVEGFDIKGVSSLGSKSYNRAPGSDVAAVIRDDNGARRLVDLHWGIAPFGAGTHGRARALINARAETVNRKPTFREAFKRRRCLVIADGYYEWQQREGRRIPWYVHLALPLPAGFAALYWYPGNGGVRPACVIITTAANELTLPIHHRMPVILSGDHVGPWLDPSTTESALLNLMRPRPPEGMDAWEVSTLVNFPGNDVPECIKPVNRP